MANNTVYGLAASVWSESINVALHAASQLKRAWSGQQHESLRRRRADLEDIAKADSARGRQGRHDGVSGASWFAQAPVLKSAPVAIDLPFENMTMNVGLLSIAR